MARLPELQSRACPEVRSAECWETAAEGGWPKARRECPASARLIAVELLLVLKPEKTIRLPRLQTLAPYRSFETLGPTSASRQIALNWDAKNADLVHLTLKD